MKAILLAGGFGTRLRRVVNDRPKAMALISGRPFIEYVIRGLKEQGITDIIFAVGYRGSMVEEYFKDGSDLGVDIRYSYEERPLGTAGAIKLAAGLLDEEDLKDGFLALNGDTYYKIDYSRFAALKREKDLDMVLVLRDVPDISRYGATTIDDNGIVTAFDEKRDEDRPGTINGGVYLLTGKLISTIPDGMVSIEHEMIPGWLREGCRIGGFVNDGYFIDIGIPDDYYKFQEDVEKGVIVW